MHIEIEDAGPRGTYTTEHRETYWQGYNDGWADAQSARLRAENQDLKEIIRIGNERMNTK